MPTVQKIKNVSSEELTRRAIDFRSLIAEHASDSEKHGRVLEKVYREAQSQEFFRYYQPARFGGLEYDHTPTPARWMLEWGSADASIGWVCGLGVVHQWLIAQFPIAAQEEVWGSNPHATACGSYAPAGKCIAEDGGFRLTGDFHFASGIDVVDWVILGVFFPTNSDDGPGVPGFTMVPKSELEILDNWDTMGLVGSGSKTVVCKEVFIPEHRKITFAQLVSGNSPGYQALQNSIYRYPFLSLVAYAISIPALGALNGALETYLDAIQDRSTRGAVVLGGSKVKDFQAVQMRVGRAAANLKAARAMLFEQLEDSRVKVVEQGTILTVHDRMENRITQAKIVELGVEGLDLLFGAVGGQGIHSHGHIQRAWRDAHAIAHHISFNWDALSAMFGQHLMGLDPQGQY
tara:strand:+ start:108 stop:1319 length:1212 start_codon:yes stop_codon:yes gene_type:complete